MENQFVSYTQAVALKELRFDESCLAYYNTEKLFKFPGTTMSNRNFLDLLTVTVPLKQQAFRWFREKHGLMHIINPYHFTAEIDYLNERIVNKQYGDFIPHDHLLDEEGEEIKHSSYEQAEQACLDKLIEICKNK